MEVQVQRKIRREVLFIIIAIVASIIFGYLMRNVQTPPDCVSEPDDPMCTVKR